MMMVMMATLSLKTFFNTPTNVDDHGDGDQDDVDDNVGLDDDDDGNTF